MAIIFTNTIACTKDLAHPAGTYLPAVAFVASQADGPHFQACCSDCLHIIRQIGTNNGDSRFRAVRIPFDTSDPAIAFNAATLHLDPGTIRERAAEMTYSPVTRSQVERASCKVCGAPLRMWTATDDDRDAGPFDTVTQIGSACTRDPDHGPTPPPWHQSPNLAS